MTNCQLTRNILLYLVLTVENLQSGLEDQRRGHRCSCNIKSIPIWCQILWHIVWQMSQILMIYWPDALQEPAGSRNVKTMLQCEEWQALVWFLLVILPLFLQLVSTYALSQSYDLGTRLIGYCSTEYLVLGGNGYYNFSCIHVYSRLFTIFGFLRFSRQSEWWFVPR